MAHGSRNGIFSPAFWVGKDLLGETGLIMSGPGKKKKTRAFSELPSPQKSTLRHFTAWLLETRGGQKLRPRRIPESIQGVAEVKRQGGEGEKVGKL